ncbi:MAG: ABC transporter substrate-binding protein [Culicoidibacterales bacterium]
MNVKKFFGMSTAALLMSVALVGCGATGGDTTDGGTAESTGKTIKVFQLKVEINDALVELAKQYEAETGTKVEITSVGGGADYGAALKAEFAKGESVEPDIFMVNGAGDIETWSHKVDDLGSEAWVANAVNGTLDAVTVDGKIQGMPVATEGYGLIYNKDLFAEAGIDGEAIDTYSELEAAIKTLDSKKADLGLDNVVSYTTKETWVTGNHTFNIPFATQEDPKQAVADYIAGSFDVVGNQNFKDWTNLVELLINYGGGATLETIDYSTQVGNFALGKTALLHQGNWTAGDMKDLGVDFEMGILPLAINEDTSVSGSIPVGVPMYWSVNKDSSVNAEARAFLDWMVSSETGQTALVEEMNMIPAFTNFEVTSEDQLAQAVTAYNNDGKTLPWVFTMFPDGFTMEKVGPIFAKLAKGEIDKTQMLAEIQALTPLN